VARPLLLDLFCGAGGAAMGYHRAGFDVVGVDIKPQPHYPFDFVLGDALGTLSWHLAAQRMRTPRFDAIHASPPCQRWLGVPGALGEEYPDLLTPVREMLRESGSVYVIENVPAAPLDGLILCGSTFGLPIIRHRRFEASFDIGLAPSLCRQSSWGRGTEHPGTYPFAHGAWRPAWREHVMPAVWPWMTIEETHEAIPPAYTQFIGEQLMEHLRRASKLLDGMEAL
jgi:DNA (cytosine-5)-methyltransferase 1